MKKLAGFKVISAESGIHLGNFVVAKENQNYVLWKNDSLGGFIIEESADLETIAARYNLWIKRTQEDSDSLEQLNDLPIFIKGHEKCLPAWAA